MSAPVAVRLWGSTIGAVHKAPNADFYSFQYDARFAQSGLELAPITMPLAKSTYAFPSLARQSFSGLPGLLSDSLPDNFGNALIDAWLVRQGRNPGNFTAIERLCYVGTRGMGALEYHPVIGSQSNESAQIEIEALVDLAGRILDERQNLSLDVHNGNEGEALTQLLRVGTSAGGARAKALIAWNPLTNEVRSGQIDNDPGFEYWILKFDGVKRAGETLFSDSLGFGAIEYAYHLMAKEAGIDMSECRLMEENGRRHFMSRRFDRTIAGEKLHMLSLGGMAHFDFNMAGAYSYEQALWVLRKLNLPMDSIEEQYRRMIFNIMTRNQDDHVKNIAFLMDKKGKWALSPAFDLTYSFNPSGEWTSSHQMTVNSKRDQFTFEDLKKVAETASMKRGRATDIVEEVRASVSRWKDFFETAKIEEKQAQEIGASLRLNLPKK
ncbi:MAG: type II toxin-antitoxin system HipA family toxin [Bacteroidetes bacterium]|nr:type II toxin-antitoxin system HipA family toxin [Bacteroidota bacterium]